MGTSRVSLFRTLLAPLSYCIMPAVASSPPENLVKMGAADGEGMRSCLNQAYREYCETRCHILNAWLSMGLEMKYGATTNLLHEYVVTDLWQVCPLEYIGLKMQSLYLQINEHGHMDLRSMDEVLHHMFHNLGMNITRLFHPRSKSFAPFLQIHRFIVAAERRRGVVARMPPGSPLAEIRAAIDVETMFPMDPMDAPGGDALEKMRSCSLHDLAVGLWSITGVSRAVNSAMLDPASAHAANATMLNSVLNAAQVCLVQLSEFGGLTHSLLETGVPLFGILDRLDCRTLTYVEDALGVLEQAPQAPSPFVMHVLQLRDFESNFVRSYGRFHCDDGYIALLKNRHAVAQAEARAFSVVEVGAYLGGCTFWPLANLPYTQALAIEQFAPAVAAMSRTAATNKLGTERFGVLGACISDDTTPFHAVVVRNNQLLQPAMINGTGGGGASMRSCITLSDALAPHLPGSGFWDLIRVHTSTAELPILRSGLDLFREGLVRTVAVMLTAFHKGDYLADIAKLFLGLGAKLTYVGQVVTSAGLLQSLHAQSIIAVPLVVDFPL